MAPLTPAAAQPYLLGSTKLDFILATLSRLDSSRMVASLLAAKESAAPPMCLWHYRFEMIVLAMVINGWNVPNRSRSRMTDQLILLNRRDNILTLTLNRPDKLNSLTIDMLSELGDAL